MAPGAPKFKEGERTLCFHGPLIYEAKCLKFRVNPTTNENEYWVHYAGWKKSWDEWVPEDRVLKYNESNLAQQKDLQKGHKPRKTKSKGGNVNRSARDSKVGEVLSEGSVNDPDSRPATPILDPRGRLKGDKKRGSPTPSQGSCSEFPKKNKRSKTDHAVETEAQFLNKVEVKIKIPDELKPWLVDENLMIVKKKKLAVLPAKITVDNVLDVYLQSKKNRGHGNMTTIAEEVTKGIKEYFNAMLGSKLLYGEERSQYNKITEENPNTEPSAIYGTHHLLRLFVKLGSTLCYSAINEKTMAILLSAFQDFLRFLAKDVAMYFSMNNFT